MLHCYIATYRTYRANTRAAMIKLNLLTDPLHLANCPQFGVGFVVWRRDDNVLHSCGTLEASLLTCRISTCAPSGSAAYLPKYRPPWPAVPNINKRSATVLICKGSLLCNNITIATHTCNSTAPSLLSKQRATENGVF
jgi:hypothetical protein